MFEIEHINSVLSDIILLEEVLLKCSPLLKKLQEDILQIETALIGISQEKSSKKKIIKIQALIQQMEKLGLLAMTLKKRIVMTENKLVRVYELDIER